MSRHPNEPRSSSPAVRRARERSGSTTAARVTPDPTAPGGVRVDLAVRVEDIPDTGITVDETVPAAFISALLDDGQEIRWTGLGDTALRLHLSHEAGFARVKGDVHFRLAHPCVRCLQTVPFETELAVDVRMLERNSAPVTEAADTPAKPKRGAQDHGWPDEDDGPLGDPTELEDLNVASYEHGTVRLDELIREQLFLELPMHPACDLPSARPTQPCAYRPVMQAPPEPKPAVDPRWAGLAALRDRLPAAAAPTQKGRSGRTEATATATLSEEPFAELRLRASTQAQLHGHVAADADPAAAAPSSSSAAPKSAAPKAPAQKAAAKKPAQTAAPTTRATKAAAKKPAQKPAARKPAQKPAARKPAQKAKKAAKKAAPRTPAKKASPQKAVKKAKPARKTAATKVRPKAASKASVRR